MRFPDREFWVKVDQKLLFLGKNREIGENREIFKKSEKRQYNHVPIIKIHILAKFHEKMIFGEIIGHLVILPLYRAQTRDFYFSFSQIYLGVCKFTHTPPE